MKAKQVKETILWHYNDAGCFALNKKEFSGLLQRYSEQLCLEQREICDESVRFENGILLDDSIINAPMPEL